MTKKIEKKNPSQLLDRIGVIITEARQRAVQTVNTMLVKTYWEIGREIVEYELGGKIRADYGEELVKNLAIQLAERYGQGFSYRNLQRMKQFYLAYSIVPTLSAQFINEKSISRHKPENQTRF